MFNNFEQIEDWKIQSAYIIHSIFNRNKLAYKAACSKLFEMTSLKDYERIHQELLQLVAKKENGTEALLWVYTLEQEDEQEDEQEEQETIAEVKRVVKRMLLESGYKLGVDFKFTISGNVILWSNEVKKFLREAFPSKNQWEQLLYLGILII